MNKQDLQVLCQLAITAARAAGDIITRSRQLDVNVQYKAVGSSAASQVVTQVDLQAQLAILEIITPTCTEYNLALVAEESDDDGLRQQKTAFWCIDPMDGTLAFINKTTGFSVSIALVSRQGKPLIGVVYNQVNQDLYYAIDGAGAYKNEQRIRTPKLDPKLALILYTDSSFETHPLLEQTRSCLQEIAQSLALNGADIQYKIGAVMNACDVLETANSCYFKYPRLDDSGGSIWDYAATACLFNEADAIAADISGKPMDLNRINNTFMNHRGVLFTGQLKLAEQIISLSRRLLNATDS